MATLAYRSPTGKTFHLFDGHVGVFVEANSIDSLTGRFEDSKQQAVGVAGTLVNFHDRLVADIEATLTVVVRDESQWQAFRSAWSTIADGALLLTNSRGTFELTVRLRQPLPFPATTPRAGSRIPLSVVGGPAWMTKRIRTGTVTIVNDGDIPIWPVIVWEGKGGEVILPSGARFTLPTVTGEHRLDLSRKNSGRVFAGTVLDRAATAAATAVGESVPAGATRVFTIPSGAQLEYSVGRFDPWT